MPVPVIVEPSILGASLLFAVLLIGISFLYGWFLDYKTYNDDRVDSLKKKFKKVEERLTHTWDAAIARVNMNEMAFKDAVDSD